MKAADKDKYVAEARDLFNKIEVDWFINNPNDAKQIAIINRLIAIFTLFSSNDGQDLQNLFREFQKWARAGKRSQHIKNCAVDMMQFIGQKIEEMDVYQITEEESGAVNRIIDELKNENLWVRTSVEDKDLHIIIGDRKSKSGKHVHLIQDASTGIIRIDRSDQPPEELVERVVSVTTKSGEIISHKQKGITTTLEFSVDSRSVDEIFNSIDMSNVVTESEHRRILEEINQEYSNNAMAISSKGAPVEIVSMRIKPIYDKRRSAEMARWSKSEIIYNLKVEQIESLYKSGSKEHEQAIAKLKRVFGKD